MRQKEKGNSEEKDRNAQQFWVWYLLLWNGKKNIEAKNVGYEKQIKELQEQVDEEKQRTEELNEYKKYVQTKKFAEEIAKDKFGLIYPDEIIFKGKK